MNLTLLTTHFLSCSLVVAILSYIFFKPVILIKATVILAQAFTSIIASSKVLETPKPSKITDKSPNRESWNFDLFFYLLNYVY